MSRQCLKFTIAFFNVLIMLIGAAAVGLGAWVLIKDTDFMDETSDILDLEILGSDLLKTCAMTMITAGAVVFVLGTLGCIGAFSLSSFLLIFYALALVVVLTVEVAVLVMVIVFRSEISEKIDEEMSERLVTHYGDSSMSFTESFDALQKEFDCCGWGSGYDFINATDPMLSAWDRTHNATTGEMKKVPEACCQSSNDTLVTECTLDPMPYNSTVYNHKGCKDEIEDKLEEYTWVIIGFTAGLLFFQFLLITLSLCLVVKNVGKKYQM